jgi:hypothetical protein
MGNWDVEVRNCSLRFSTIAKYNVHTQRKTQSICLALTNLDNSKMSCKFGCSHGNKRPQMFGWVLTLCFASTAGSSQQSKCARYNNDGVDDDVLAVVLGFIQFLLAPYLSLRI